MNVKNMLLHFLSPYPFWITSLHLPVLPSLPSPALLLSPPLFSPLFTIFSPFLYHSPLLFFLFPIVLSSLLFPSPVILIQNLNIKNSFSYLTEYQFHNLPLPIVTTFFHSFKSPDVSCFTQFVIVLKLGRSSIKFFFYSFWKQWYFYIFSIVYWNSTLLF